MIKSHIILPKNNSVQYDDFGDTFGKSRQDLHWDDIDDILSAFLVHFSPTTGQLADIGCGNGRLFKHIQEHDQSALFQNTFSTYIGLDSSSVLLNQARSHSAFSDFFMSTNWIQGDMRQMQEELEEYGLFDGIFFIASFHHLMFREERIAVLSQAKNLLSQTGKIVMINWHLLHPLQEKYHSSQITSYSDKSADFEIKIGAHKRFYHAFSHEEYLSLAQEVGLVLSDSFGERNSMVVFQQ